MISNLDAPIVLKKALQITFNSDGVGTINNIPSGYSPICGYYDINWNLTLFGSGHCKCYSVSDASVCIKDYTGPGTFLLYKD